MEDFDLRAETKFKNNILHGLIFPRFIGVKQAAEVIGVSYGYLLNILHLKHSPNARLGRSSEVVRSKPAVKIAQFFGLPFEDVFPETLYSLCLPEVAVRLFKSPEILSLSAASAVCDGLPSPEDGVIVEDFRNKLLQAVYRLPVGYLGNGKGPSYKKKRERNVEVIRMKYGFGCDPATSQEIAERLKLSRTRVDQIEKQILRQLAHHPNCRGLVGDLESLVRERERAVSAPESNPSTLL